MFKSSSIILALIFGVASLSYSQGKDSSTIGQRFLITQAYSVYYDSSRVLNEFVDSSTYITVLSRNDSSCAIVFDHGIDNVFLIGKAKKIKNTFFNATRDDAECFKWSCVSSDDTIGKEVLVFIEYVTDSLEERHAKYYFLNFVFSDLSQFQFYGRLIKETKKKHGRNHGQP